MNVSSDGFSYVAYVSWDLIKKNTTANVQLDGKKRNLRLILKRPTRMMSIKTNWVMSGRRNNNKNGKRKKSS